MSDTVDIRALVETIKSTSGSAVEPFRMSFDKEFAEAEVKWKEEVKLCRFQDILPPPEPSKLSFLYKKLTEINTRLILMLYQQIAGTRINKLLASEATCSLLALSPMYVPGTIVSPLEDFSTRDYGTWEGMKLYKYPTNHLRGLIPENLEPLFVEFWNEKENKTSYNWILLDYSSEEM